MIWFCILGYVAGVVTLCASFKIGCGEVTLGTFILSFIISAVSFIPIRLERNVYSIMITLVPVIAGVVTIFVLLLTTKADMKLF